MEMIVFKSHRNPIQSSNLENQQETNHQIDDEIENDK